MFGRALRELTAPNIRLFMAYRPENLRPDLVAALSVAAVQTPTAIAYTTRGIPPYRRSICVRPSFPPFLRALRLPAEDSTFDFTGAKGQPSEGSCDGTVRNRL